MGLEDMLVPAGMLPTLPVLSMLPSVRLRLSQRLKLMLLFFMEDMDMVVLDMLDLAMLVLDTAMLLLLLMATPVLAMLVLDMVVLATLVLDTLARGLLMLSQRPRLMLVFCMEDMDMDSDMLVVDMLDMEDMVLDMAVVPTLVKHQMQASKSSKVILLFSALFRAGIDVIFRNISIDLLK